MGKSVMVVDDSRVVHPEMKKLLADTDFEIVGCCRSGEEAIAFYGEHKPDLVTMDIIMPGMDGLAAARAIIGNWPDARIIMVSSLAYDDTIDESVKIGAKGFIFKPLERTQLIHALEHALTI